ncbi:MAG: multidrug effflux MFS transporter [Pseudomonadota bacterium]
MSSQSAPATTSARNDFWLIALLAAVTAVGPFTLHALSPALPAVSADFRVPAAAAQLMLSLSLVAMAVSTLAWGPLSDRYGRRPVLVAGLVMASLGSVLAAVAPELWLAVLGRLLQAAGGAAGIVLARAVAQDVFGSERSGDVIGKVTAVMVAAPMVSPTVSGLLVDASGWRATFWMSAILCAALVVWTRLGLAETAVRSTGAAMRDLLNGFRIVGRRRVFWRYAGYASFSLAGFYYFVAITPYVMRETYGQGAAAYGLYFMMLSATFMVMNFVAGPISARFGQERTLMAGAVLSLVGPMIIMALVLADIRAPWVLFVPGMIQSFGAGLAMPNTTAGAVGAAPERAGAASGLLGFSQFILAAVTTQIAGWLPHDTAFWVPGGQLIWLGLGLACLFLLRRGHDA